MSRIADGRAAELLATSGRYYVSKLLKDSALDVKPLVWRRGPSLPAERLLASRCTGADELSQLRAQIDD